MAMLAHRALPWKAVGLTAKVAQWALKGNSRRSQGGQRKRVAAPVPTVPGERRQETRGTHPGEAATAIPQAKVQNQRLPPSEACQTASQAAWARPVGCGTGRTGKGKPLPGASLLRWGCHLGRDRGAGVWEQEQEEHKIFWLGDLKKPEVWAAFLTEKGKRLAGGDGQEVKKPARDENSERPAAHKEQEKADKATPPVKKEGDEGGGEGGGGDDQKKVKGEGGDPPLCYAPVCCSCTKQGVDKLKHKGLVSQGTTFARLPIRKGSTTLIGVCLAPNPRGSVDSTRAGSADTPLAKVARLQDVTSQCVCAAPQGRRPTVRLREAQVRCRPRSAGRRPSLRQRNTEQLNPPRAGRKKNVVGATPGTATEGRPEKGGQLPRDRRPRRQVGLGELGNVTAGSQKPKGEEKNGSRV